MTRGTITKVVSTFGSQWGRIQPDGSEKQLFFNTQSLLEAADFALLKVGQVVDFESHTDQINGAHAENLTIVSDAAPVTAELAP